MSDFRVTLTSVCSVGYGDGKLCSRRRRASIESVRQTNNPVILERETATSSHEEVTYDEGECGDPASTSLLVFCRLVQPPREP